MTTAELWRLAQQKASYAPKGEKLKRLAILKQIATELLERELADA